MASTQSPIYHPHSLPSLRCPPQPMHSSSYETKLLRRKFICSISPSASTEMHMGHFTLPYLLCSTM
eukprot:3758059-Ditylum_brightwellii.AAC.1